VCVREYESAFADSSRARARVSDRVDRIVRSRGHVQRIGRLVKSQTRRAQNQGCRVRAVRVIPREGGLFKHREVPGHDSNIESRDGPAQYVRDKYVRPRTLVVEGEVPRPVEECRIGQSLEQIAAAIDDLESTLADRS